MFEEQVDLSMRDICICDLDEIYGKSILKKRVTLFANDCGVMVDGFTHSGVLKDILNDKLLGDFFSEQQVVLIEKDGDSLAIDYRWDDEARKEYIRSIYPYCGEKKYDVLFENDLKRFGRGYSAYMNVVCWLETLDLDDLLKVINSFHCDDWFSWLNASWMKC